MIGLASNGSKITRINTISDEVERVDPVPFFSTIEQIFHAVVTIVVVVVVVIVVVADVVCRPPYTAV